MLTPPDPKPPVPLNPLRTNGSLSEIIGLGESTALPLPLFTTGVPAGFPSPAAEVTLVRFHLARQFIAGLLAGDESAQTHEESDCRVGLHPDQFRRRPCRGPCRSL